MRVGGVDLRTNSGRTAAGRPGCGSAADRSRHLCFSRPRQFPRALPFSHIVSSLRSLKQVVRTCTLYRGWGSRSARTCFHARPAHCLGFISPRWQGRAAFSASDTYSSLCPQGRAGAKLCPENPLDTQPPDWGSSLHRVPEN